MQTLTPRERAIWALLGDPHVVVPRPLEELVERITTAIKQQLASYIEAIQKSAAGS